MISRTTALRTVGVIVCSLLTACVTQGSSDEVERPNILIIVTDDQPLGMLEAMPATRELFAQEGVTFGRAFATTPSCCPSRASMFTGRYAHNHGIRRNNAARLPYFDHSVTMQRYLRSAGYSTAIVGKYLNKWPLNEDPPHFDDWVINNGSVEGDGYYYGSEWNNQGERVTVDGYSTDFVEEWSLRILRRVASRDRPWFLYVAPLAPHSFLGEPPMPAPEYERAPLEPWEGNPAVREADVSDKPRFNRRDAVSLREASAFRALQMRSLMSVDDLIDRLFSTLRELGEDEETLAVFISDNGHMLGEHNLLTKLYPYLPSTQVPMMMRGPGRIEGGGVDDRLVANIDLAPTFLEAAGLEDEGDSIDGSSLLGDDWDRERLLLEGWGFGPMRLPTWASVVGTDYQYIEYYKGKRGRRVAAREYYDLASDPWELSNLLADDDPSNDPDVDALSDALAEDRACARSDCP